MTRGCILLLYDTLLAILAIEDLKNRKIRNRYPMAILCLSLAAVFVLGNLSVLSRIFGMLIVSIPMLFLALWLPGSFGGGDVKLSFACGAFLGGELVIEGTTYAVLLAGMYCIYLLLRYRKIKNIQFALGPFLAIGYGIAGLKI